MTWSHCGARIWIDFWNDFAWSLNILNSGQWPCLICFLLVSWGFAHSRRPLSLARLFRSLFSVNLLKFVLVFGWPDVVSTSCVWQLTMVLVAYVTSVGAQNGSFGMPVASTFARWGPSSDPAALGSKRKETLGSRLGFLLIMDGFRDRV